MSDLGIKNWTSTPVPVEETGAIPLPTGEFEAVCIEFDVQKTNELTHSKRYNIITSHGEFIIGNKCRRCTECGKETNLIEICYEAPFCSDECVAAYDEKCFIAMGGTL